MPSTPGVRSGAALDKITEHPARWFFLEDDLRPFPMPPYYYSQWPHACLITLPLPEPFQANAVGSVEREEMIYGTCGWSLR